MKKRVFMLSGLILTGIIRIHCQTRYWHPMFDRSMSFENPAFLPIAQSPELNIMTYWNYNFWNEGAIMGGLGTLTVPVRLSEKHRLGFGFSFSDGIIDNNSWEILEINRRLGFSYLYSSGKRTFSAGAYLDAIDYKMSTALSDDGWELTHLLMNSGYGLTYTSARRNFYLGISVNPAQDYRISNPQFHPEGEAYEGRLMCFFLHSGLEGPKIGNWSLNPSLLLWRQNVVYGNLSVLFEYLQKFGAGFTYDVLMDSPGIRVNYRHGHVRIDYVFSMTSTQTDKLPKGHFFSLGYRIQE